MSQAIVRELMEQRLSDWAILQELRIVWENSPARNQPRPYIAAFLLPGENQNLFLDGTHVQQNGVFQISFYHDSSKGTGYADDLAEEIRALFSPAVLLSNQNLKVNFTRPAQVKTFANESEYLVILSVFYQANY